MTTKNKDFRDDVIKLMDAFTGQAKLEAEHEKALELKKRAIERQKEIQEKNIAKGKAKLEKNVVEEEDIDEDKVVQNIKLFEWTVPNRLRFPFDIRAFFTILLISMFFILYLAVVGQIYLMFAVIALLFFIYVSGITPPINVTHKITKRGVEVLDKLYEWFTLKDFYFCEKNGQYVMYINTRLRYPARLILLMEKKDVTAIFMLLQDKILYKDIKKQDFFSVISEGVYIPLDSI